jgi:hypothetical protein
VGTVLSARVCSTVGGEGMVGSGCSGKGGQRLGKANAREMVSATSMQRLCVSSMDGRDTQNAASTRPEQMTVMQHDSCSPWQSCGMSRAVQPMIVMQPTAVMSPWGTT